MDDHGLGCGCGNAECCEICYVRIDRLKDGIYYPWLCECDDESS